MSSAPLKPIDQLVAIMARLRDPADGCEWDLVQTFETIAPYTIEEAYEVADAIEQKDMEALREELGDLLLQVVFHSRLAEESGAFAFDDVARTITGKMIARHPHVFANVEGAMSEARWEDLKAEERKTAGARSAMDGVALALPALLRAHKLQKRAAREGFDWPDRDGPRAKVLEELAELDAANGADIAEEAGDLLFAVVNLVRSYGLDAEQALRAANAKFERRFRAMEDLAQRSSEKPFAALPLDRQDALWQAVKAQER
ncbi:nucleoside triphosphate pyrophosphohydrolase [Qipengyuania sp.]|uniref:nucleoside triphosphate pyrophosphohydrolase n=1 Tax=Qipengyuania sp. TaxID=2004515 RepID=UPI0037370112